MLRDGGGQGTSKTLLVARRYGRVGNFKKLAVNDFVEGEKESFTRRNVQGHGFEVRCFACGLVRVHIHC